MAACIVVGLFQSKGEADNAAGRLLAEGILQSEVAVRVLHETGPVPDKMESELAALTVDPLVLGDVRNTFVRYITNGETAVCVRAATPAGIDYARDMMKLYGPVAIEVVALKGEISQP